MGFDSIVISSFRIHAPAVVPVRTWAWNGELDWEGGSGGRCSCRTRRTCSALEVSAGRPRDSMGNLRRSLAPRSEAG